MTIDTNKIKDQARDGIAEALGDAYDCMLVWSAWGVGTMGPDDFVLVVEDESRLEEITDAALAPALAVIDAQAAEIERLRQPWQPIETAPTGAMLLLADMTAQEARHWAYVDYLTGGKCCVNRYRTPTHWMPLPSPPAALSGESNDSD